MLVGIKHDCLYISDQQNEQLEHLKILINIVCNRVEPVELDV